MASVGVVLALLSVSACSPLTSLRRDLEQVNAFRSGYQVPADDHPKCPDGLLLLRHAAIRSGIVVEYTDAIRGGLANPAERTAYVEAGLPVCGQVEVLAHELGHLLEPPNLSTAERQMFADAVSYLFVRRAVGYDPRARYATYLGQFKNASDVLRQYHVEIQQVVAWLLDEPRG